MLKNKLKYYGLKLAFVLFLIPFGLILLLAEILTGCMFSIEDKLAAIAKEANIKHKPWFTRKQSKEVISHEDNSDSNK